LFQRSQSFSALFCRITVVTGGAQVKSEAMSVQLNHTIVWCRDKVRSAGFLSQILGLPEPRPFLHFLIVDMTNGVSLDYFETSEHLSIQHYAFLVSEAEFDAIVQRLRERDVVIWADPSRQRAGEINRHFGGRGVYFQDPDGHLLEIITRPYGTEAQLRAEAS
jgi:catechol 2,3-dioxygenase-like lactoylglutathione lyase family enzyme